MNNLISMIGGKSRALDIVKYQKEYFRNFTYYDSKSKVFAKKIDSTRPHDFVPVQLIESELSSLVNV